MPVNPKYLAKLAEEQKVAIEALVKAVERLEKKVDALARMVRTLKE